MDATTAAPARSTTPLGEGDTPPTGRLRSWAIRHPVTAFLVVVFGLGYPVMALPVLADHGVIADGWMPRVAGLDPERLASMMAMYLALLPAVALVTWLVDGPRGIRLLVARTFRWRIGAGWALFVLTALPVTTIVIALLLGDSLRPVDVGTLAVGQLIGLLVNLLVISVWEEMAWAGFMQTRLEARRSVITAALITTVPFALIHMPLQFIGDFTSGSLAAAFAGLLVLGALLRVMNGVVLRGARDSVLAVAVLHGVFNRTNNDEGVVAAVLVGDMRGLSGLIAVVLATGVAALMARRRLGRAYRATLTS